MSTTNVNHGLTGTKEHTAWISMRQRCSNANNDSYYRYGGRGICVCEQWESFDTFLRDVEFAPTPNHEIDRIDCDGNYEPSNVRWATRITQMNNRSICHHVTAFDRKWTLAELAASRYCCVSYKVLGYRIRNGWKPESAASTPVGKTASNSIVSAFGRELTVAELSRHELCVVRRDTLALRIRNGMNAEIAAITPTQPGKKFE